MKLCPHCREVLSLHIGMYRCSHCHLWLEAEQCLDAKQEPLKTMRVPLTLPWRQEPDLPSGNRTQDNNLPDLNGLTSDRV